MKWFMEKMLKALEILKSFYRRRVLFFTVVGVVATLVVFAYWYSGMMKEQKVVAKEKEPVQKVVKDIFIDIPPGAFATTKEFKITPLPNVEIEALRKNVGPFVGNVYEITPSDGKKEFAYIPMKLKFYFPPDYYYGYDFNNLSLAYIPDDNPGVYKVFSGSEMGKDDRGYFVEAEVFHTSKIGVIAKVPKKQTLGLKLINEIPASPKPAIIILPGEDVNFSGFLGGKVATNIWESLFPDRNIFVYEYPLMDSRSMAYRDMVREFFEKTGRESYLAFEADRFARELKRYDKWEFHIIAHGIGGLIARLALETHPEIKNVKKVVLLSTPNGGTNVANPVYFASLMYGKSHEALSKIFNLPENEVRALYLHVYNYIETVNTYWKDILPGSKILKEISKTRKDIEYLTLIGETPPLDIDLSGNDLGRFYPELIRGEGDGVVSVESAKIEDVPLLKFKGSFFDYYTRAEVMNVIRDFIESDVLPRVPEYKTDEYAEYVPEKVLKSEGMTTEATETEKKPEEKPKRVEKSFTGPEGFEVADILSEVGSLNIPDYDSAGCLNGDPYIASSRGLNLWNRVVKRGNFSHLKLVNGNLTMVCGGKTCLVNSIGFKELKDLGDLDLESADDVLVTEEGDPILALRREAGIVDLVIFKDGSLKRLDFSPGTVGRIIPQDGKMIFLTDSMITLLDMNGKVLKKISASTMAKEGYSLRMTYALEEDGYLFVLTKDYYLLVYDEKTGKSWILGEGWVGNLKILSTGRALIILGNRSVNFVDIYDRKLLRFIQMFDSEIVDGFLCDRKLYLVLKNESGYTLKVLSVGTGIL